MSNSSNVFAGYKHVESFGPDDEYEDEVEECYVTLDLGGVEPTLVPSSSTFRIAGLETDTPFLQISGTVMRGQHQTLLGTELIFRDTSEDDSANVSGSPLEHVANTDRRIKFRAVELQPKENRQVNGSGESSQQRQTESDQPGAVASASTAKDNQETVTDGVGPARDAMELDE